MTAHSFKGIRPTAPDHIGLLVQFFNLSYGLMLWDYQRKDIKEHGWLIFRLDEVTMLPKKSTFFIDERYETIRLDDVHMQVIGVASTNTVPRIELSEVS